MGVFCSRDLESNLSAFVQAELAAGHCPSDDELRAKARAILGMDQTAADDVELLRKFKALHGITSASIGHLGDSMPLALMNDDSFLAEFDHELQGMDLSTVDFSGSNSHSNSNSNSGSSGSGSPEFFLPQAQTQSQPISNLSSQLQSQSQSHSPSSAHPQSHSQPTIHQPTPRSKSDGPAIESKSTLAYTVIGEAFSFGPNQIPAKPEDFEFAKTFWELTRGLLEEGKVKVHKPSVNKYGKGFEGILKGMDEMKNGNVSGEKLVFTL